MANIALASSELRYGIVWQGTYGTGELDSVDYNIANNGVELQSEHFNLLNELNVRDAPAANGVRFQTAGDTQVDANEAMPESSVNAPVALQEFFDLFCVAWFQKVTEVASGTALKTFALPVAGEVQQPDFSLGAGFFFTVTERHPTASRSRKMIDAICKDLALKIEPSGKLSMTAVMAGRGIIEPTSNPSGTWTKYQIGGYHYADMVRHTIDFGAGPVSVAPKGAIEIPLTQVLSKCGIDAGKFENPGITDRGGTFKFPFQDDANTMTAYANAVAGTPVTFNLGWGNATPGTDDGDLDITISGILTEDVVREKDGIMSAVLTGKLQGADAATSPATILMANSIVRGF